MVAGFAAAKLHVPLPALVAHAFDRRFKRDHAAAILELALHRQHVAVAVDDAGFRRPQRTDAEQLFLHGARGIAADHLDALDAVALRLRHDGLDLGELGLVGGDDQLAAFAMVDAMRGAELVEQAPAAHAQQRAQRVGRIIETAVDDFAELREETPLAIPPVTRQR